MTRDELINGGYSALEKIQEGDVLAPENEVSDLPERYNIRLPTITEDLVEQFYPWLIADDGDGYTWNQAAVDFACVLKSSNTQRKYKEQSDED